MSLFQWFSPDAGRKNAIPIAMAAILAQRLGLEPVGSITQTNDVAHTASNAPSRILAQPTFSGKIRPFARVLIVDDAVTFGSTIANLRGWIHQQRAVVVGCSCLAAAFGSTKLKPPQSIRNITTTPITTWRKHQAFLASAGPTARPGFFCSNRLKPCSNSFKLLMLSITLVTTFREAKKDTQKPTHTPHLPMFRNPPRNCLPRSGNLWYTASL
jgi:hypothetical protein